MKIEHCVCLTDLPDQCKICLTNVKLFPTPMPRKFLKNRNSEIEFGDVLESVYNASAH